MLTVGDYNLLALKAVKRNGSIQPDAGFRCGKAPDIYKTIVLGCNYKLQKPYATWEADGDSMYNIRYYENKTAAVADYYYRIADAREGIVC